MPHTPRRLPIIAAAAVCLLAMPAAAFQHQEFRAADGTAYQVLRSVAPIGGGADLERVTTMAGAIGGTGGCNATTTTASALNGVIAPGQQLHPFGSIRRTAILVPNDITAIAFDDGGSGTVTIGSGGGAVRVCRSGNCSGAALVGLATGDAGVPAACLANGVQAACEGNQRQTIAFGLAAAGNPPVCQTAPTVNTDVCDPTPSDGFSLEPGEAIVFVYNGSLGGVGFGVGAGAFGIDSDAEGSVCQEGGVVSATAPSQSLPGPGLPRSDTTAPLAGPAGLAALAAALLAWGARRIR